MKRTGLGLLAAAALSLGLGQAAQAADMGPAGPIVRAPAPVVAAPIIVSNWTGCFLGLNIGGAWGNKNFYELTADINHGSHTPSGFVGGGQIGCDYQMNIIVLGVQGMFNGAYVKGSHTGGDPSSRLEWFGVATGRLGVAIVPNALIYARGGWAWMRERFEVSPDRVTATRTGWTAGGGIEWMFAPNWSVFAEYSYYDLGRQNYQFPTVTANNVRIRQTMQIGLVGVNFRFGPAPVMARY